MNQRTKRLFQEAEVTKVRGRKLLKFLLVGLPAFAIAVPLNFYLVEMLGISKFIAYAIVQVFQVTINFFLCIVFVFKRDQEKSLVQQFITFMVGILAVRVMDWMFYGLLIGPLRLPYIAAQIVNVVLFALVKYKIAATILENQRVGYRGS